MANFKLRLTERAKVIYELVLDYRNSARQSPISKYEFLDYCPELEHYNEGELFTVFKTKLGERIRYVCYGSEDSLEIRSFSTVVKRINAHLAN
jgi:hypothetical protein